MPHQIAIASILDSHDWVPSCCFARVASTSNSSVPWPSSSSVALELHLWRINLAWLKISNLENLFRFGLAQQVIDIHAVHASSSQVGNNFCHLAYLHRFLSAVSLPQGGMVTTQTKLGWTCKHLCQSVLHSSNRSGKHRVPVVWLEFGGRPFRYPQGYRKGTLADENVP